MKKYSFALLILLFVTKGYSQEKELYVSDAANFNVGPWKILKYDANGDNPQTFISQNLNWPQDILFLEEKGEVLISNLGTNNIVRFDAETGDFLSVFASGIAGPTRMKIGPDGLLYVLQWSGNGFVKRYKLDGELVDDFTSTNVSQSIGLVWDDQGHLYVSSYNGGFIRKFNQEGKDQGAFINSNLSGPTNIEIDDDGNFLVFDWNNGVIQKFDSSGQFLETFIQGVGNCEGIEYMNNGNILVGVGALSSVKMYTKEGVFIEDFISSGSGGLMRPNALRFRNKETSRTDDEHEELFDVYPTQGTRFYFSNTNPPTGLELEVFDSSGKLVFSSELNSDIAWDARGFVSGRYLIKIYSERGIAKAVTVFVK